MLRGTGDENVLLVDRRVDKTTLVQRLWFLVPGRQKEAGSQGGSAGLYDGPAGSMQPLVGQRVQGPDASAGPTRPCAGPTRPDWLILHTTTNGPHTDPRLRAVAQQPPKRMLTLT